MKNIGKWLATIRIFWGQFTAYRVNFLLMVFGPSLVFFFVKYNLWSSVYESSDFAPIAGYSFEEMISYHGWAFITGLMIQTHSAANLSEDIRLGKISTYLIYPFNFWEFHLAGFIAFQVLQAVITTVTTLSLFAMTPLVFPDLTGLLQVAGYSLYISFFWYSIQYITGILAFWLEETWILRVMFQIIAAFLSGAIIPLELFPSWFAKALDYTPFPYLAHYPIKIALGHESLSLYPVVIIAVYLVGTVLLASYLWKKGVRLYTAAGM